MGRRLRRLWVLIPAIPLLLLAGLFGFVFYDRYWRWRDCFQENGEGRCWGCDGSDDCHVYAEAAGPIWGGLALICVTLALPLVLYAFRRPG